MPDTKTKHELLPESVEVLVHLENLGFQVNCSVKCLNDDGYRGTPDWTASNPERGIRLKISQIQRSWSHEPHIDVDIAGRTDIGTYKKLGVLTYRQEHSNFSFTDFCRAEFNEIASSKVHNKDDCNAFLESLRGKEPTNNWKRKSDLPKPFPFRPMVEDYNPDDRPFNIAGDSEYVVSRRFFTALKIARLVVISDKIELSSMGIERPGADVWFQVSGYTTDNKGSKVSAVILVNPEITGFYALAERTIKGKRTMVITPNMSPNNGDIRFHEVSELDQLMIQRAVQKFAANL